VARVRRSTDVAVVGAGINGLATALALADRGIDHRVFEAARPGAGQSAGRTRLFRHGHRTQELVELARDALVAWGEWEERLGVTLLGRQGVLVTGAEAEPHVARLGRAGVAARLVQPPEQEALLPLLRAPGGPALLDEDGGSIDVRTSIRALAGAAGERLVTAEVFGLVPGDPTLVETSEGIWEAGRVVLCAGAGLDSLTRVAGLEVPLSVGCHARATFAVGAPGACPPCLQEQTGAYGEVVYATPVPGEPLYAVGLAGDDNEVPLGPGRERDASGLVERISRYVSRALPGLDPEPVEVRLCLTTILPEGSDNFRIWERGPVIALAGDNLFKFAPLLGRLLAAAASGEPPPAWLRAGG
jgi:sarcosine oxidase